MVYYGESKGEEFLNKIVIVIGSRQSAVMYRFRFGDASKNTVRKIG